MIKIFAQVTVVTVLSMCAFIPASLLTGESTGVLYGILCMWAVLTTCDAALERGRPS